MNRRLIRVVLVLGVLAVLLIVADRVAAVFAGEAASNYLAKQADFAKSPNVDIHGVPFITQAVEGRYRDVEIKSGPVRLGQVDASSIDIHLDGAHLPLSSAFGGTIHQLPVDTVHGTVTISYPELEKLSKINGLTLTDEGGKLTASATLPIPGSTVTAKVSGVAATVVNGDALVLHVTDVTVAGVTVPAASVSQLASTLATPIPLPKLPFGLVLDSVQAAPTGVVVTGSGQQVVISQPGG